MCLGVFFFRFRLKKQQHLQGDTEVSWRVGAKGSNAFGVLSKIYWRLGKKIYRLVRRRVGLRFRPTDRTDTPNSAVFGVFVLF